MDKSAIEFYNVRVIQDNTGHVLTLREEEKEVETLLALNNVKYIVCTGRLSQKVDREGF